MKRKRERLEPAASASGEPDRLILCRESFTLTPDKSRVLIQPFGHGSDENCRRVAELVLSLSDEDVERQVETVLGDFSDRHVDLEGLLTERFRQVRHYLPTDGELSHSRRVLVGSYFMSEYALESAALFNPSIVAHPDQSGMAADALRFVLSLRATGEGHISSIEFRCGIVDGQGRVSVDPGPDVVTPPLRVDYPEFAKEAFHGLLDELGINGHVVGGVLDELGDRFSYPDLERLCAAAIPSAQEGCFELEEILGHIRTLGESNYDVHFAAAVPLSQRILFPRSPTERGGIEDARFVLFREDDGSECYYATYTAYDGELIFPQLLKTVDFLHFRMRTLRGEAARNKGMALFPRRLDGRYAMLSRHDNAKLFLSYSDDLHIWEESLPLAKPVSPWEFAKIGNCGSPIETDAGWLVLTHGVGAMRKYCIGAMLLDRNDPSKVIGRLRDPLIEPAANEREGYVPNVVYTCGALIHGGQVVIPFAMSDYATTVATIGLQELLEALLANR